MGVTIFVNGGLFKISMPYLSLQQMRIKLLRVTIDYIQQNGECYPSGSEESEDTENLLEGLKKCFQVQEETETREREEFINYEEFKTLDLLFLKNELIGIFKFVNHSDCDGYHSSGDAHDILKSFEKLHIGFFNKEKKGEDVWEKRIRILCNIFTEASSHEKYVEYC